jgi:ubiquinone/menaquinone biosynthesis C-methylase UbiE
MNEHHTDLLSNILHKIVAQPRIYDLVQYIVGGDAARRRMTALMADLPSGALVLDVGGGTGFYRDCVPEACHYCCVDYDMVKLYGFRHKFNDSAVRGDGTALSFAASTVDCIICISFFHHLTDAQLPQTFAECTRLLKPNGRLVILEPVWDSRHWLGRLLWAYDRGSYPRTIELLESTLAKYGTMTSREVYGDWHTYLVCSVTPKR